MSCGHVLGAVGETVARPCKGAYEPVYRVPGAYVLGSCGAVGLRLPGVETEAADEPARRRGDVGGADDSGWLG